MAVAFPHATVALWATDELRVGLQPILANVWCLPGQRPVAPVQHRSAWRYLVGFVPPAAGRTVFHLPTRASSDRFAVELAAFAQAAGAGPPTPIVLVLDRAGWPTSPRLRVPAHVQLLLPAYSPQLTPAEHRWPVPNAVLRNRHFPTIDDLDDAQAARCLALHDRRDLGRSTTLFHWWPKLIYNLQQTNSR